MSEFVEKKVDDVEFGGLFLFLGVGIRRELFQFEFVHEFDEGGFA